MIGYLYMFMTALCWSFAGVCIRFNTQSALLISGINGITGLVINYSANKGRIRFNRTVLAAAVSQFLMGITFTVANHMTTVGNAIILQYTSMIFVLLYQVLETRKLPSLKQIGVVAIVIVGMLVFFLDSLSPTGMIGNIIAILSGAFFGLQFHVNTKENADPPSSMILSFLMNISLLIFVMKDLPLVKPVEWGVMLVQGIVCAGLGSFFFSRGISRVHPLSANIICMSEILFSPLWALLLFHEKMSIYALAGAGIMVVGIILNLFLENR